MFSLDESGSVIYNENIINDGNLFGDPELIENTAEEDRLFLDQISYEIENSINSSEPVVEVSDGDAAAYSQNINYYTVYAVPSSSTGFPNSSSVSYLEDVVKGYPLDYTYVAYRTSDSYAQAMILFIGPKAVVSGSNVSIENCDVIELQYNAGSGYNQYTISRNFYHEDLADIRLDSDVLAYTNAVEGYATFDTTMQRKSDMGIFSYILVGVIAFLVIQRLIGGYRH